MENLESTYSQNEFFEALVSGVGLDFEKEPIIRMYGTDHSFLDEMNISLRAVDVNLNFLSPSTYRKIDGAIPTAHAIKTLLMESQQSKLIWVHEKGENSDGMDILNAILPPFYNEKIIQIESPEKIDEGYTIFGNNVAYKWDKNKQSRLEENVIYREFITPKNGWFKNKDFYNLKNNFDASYNFKN